FVDVVFDRDINPNTFTGADVVRVTGPTGPVSGPFTVQANPPGTPAPLANRTFRITFPAQQALAGTYTAVLGPDIQATTGLNGADRLDMNLNAGLFVLRGADPTSAQINENHYDKLPGPPATFVATLSPGRVTTSTITVPDNFAIQGVRL